MQLTTEGLALTDRELNGHMQNKRKLLVSIDASEFASELAELDTGLRKLLGILE
ncbi:MAG: hypothetical protein P1U80_06770 [Pseudomonadales bacterium]|nr:hypothetical protein [Pseudomonadales bacterium]